MPGQTVAQGGRFPGKDPGISRESPDILLGKAWFASDISIDKNSGDDGK